MILLIWRILKQNKTRQENTSEIVIGNCEYQRQGMGSGGRGNEGRWSKGTNLQL